MLDVLRSVVPFSMIRLPQKAVPVAGLANAFADNDLPCPWCNAYTVENDPRCPSCGRRFG